MKVEGILIKLGVALITSVDDCYEPSFCEVTEIFSDETSAVWLGLKELNTVSFHTHLNSWVVKRTDLLQLKRFKDLVSVQVLPIRPARFNGDILQHITLKYSP